MPRLIIRSPNHVGDCVMSLSAVGALRDLFRDSQINILAPDFLAGLYKNHPSVDEVYTLRAGAQHGVASISGIARELARAGGGFEIGILLTDSLSSAIGFRLARVTKRYGYPGNARRALLSAAADPRGLIHRSTRYQRLVSFAARRFWANPYWVDEVSFEPPAIYLKESERKAAETLLRSGGALDRRQFIALAPQAVAESRRWGLDNYAALARRIVAELDCSVALIGSSADRAAGETVRALAGAGVYNLCGLTRLRGAAALLERAACFVGNDSGVAHLAALVNTPLVALSGADKPAETSPVSQRKTVLIRSELACISCVKNVCPRSGAERMRCMKLIAVGEVFDAVRGRLVQ
ncbi:MAG TPA: lipopolysaccharide heptosyltransferase II [candidate division Zixibacteria bacterium]|nr:lipopolysaccharide heptosyltransferase II [candidate division Zixibacteria bacterium]